MKEAARLFDMSNHPGMITKGSGNVLINSLPAARANDLQAHTCTMPPLAGPHPPNAILIGSKTVLINSLPAARKGNGTACGAMIVTGSLNVQIGG
jgi:uncharacterized Zn-binding protein involved in type VI secretion